MRWLSIALLSFAAACGGSGNGDHVDAGGGDDTPTPDGTPGMIDADPASPDAAVGYVPLITANWSLGPGQEGYICATKTMTEDVYAGRLRPMAPLGTHHTVIAMNDPSGPDNPSFPCGAEFGAFWASGYGTGELALPAGVGLLAPAGKQLRLSLHLFNASDEPISGTSGLEIIPMEAAEVDHVASVSYHGPFAFAIPPNNMPYTATNNTSIGTRTIVAIFPHMHQLGSHFRASIVGANATTLWDEDYQFESQEFAPLAEIPIDSGDQVRTECTWINDTGGTVTWGESSNAEMCFTILMTY